MPHVESYIVRHCLEALFSNRKAFARRFYERLFERVPMAKHLFSHDLRRQEMMLYSSMTMVATCLEAGKDVAEDLAAFGRLHARAGVGEDLFEAFGQAFLDTMVEFLPDHDPSAIALAWNPTWAHVSEAMIEGIRSAPEPAHIPVFRRPTGN